jgi:tetratricopeptide (TPR) repeat protein
MRWENLAVPIAVSVETSTVLLESQRRELHGLPGFFWQSFAQAANWAARHNVSLDEADAWADRAVSLNRNFTTLRAKALVAEKRGDAAKSASLRQEALKVANEADMNAYGYELLQTGKVDEAIEVFRGNVKTYPESWNVYDSLGEALAVKGDKSAAKAQYEKALSMVQDAVNRKRIEGILTGLNSGTQ